MGSQNANKSHQKKCLRQRIFLRPNPIIIQYLMHLDSPHTYLQVHLNTQPQPHFHNNIDTPLRVSILAVLLIFHKGQVTQLKLIQRILNLKIQLAINLNLIKPTILKIQVI